jgi:hypothetical protein
MAGQTWPLLVPLLPDTAQGCMHGWPNLAIAGATAGRCMLTAGQLLAKAGRPLIPLLEFAG